MLLCQLNPNTATLEQAKQCTNDVTGPPDFLRLLQRFEDLAKCEPQHRPLLEWLHVARAWKLRYHPWIDRYVEAAGLDVEGATAAEPVPTVADDASPLTAEPTPKVRRGWFEIAGPYMVERLRAGRFATAVELNHTLHTEAGSAESPFDQGTGPHRGSLFIRELAAPLALKTIQNNWAKLKEEAAKS